MILTMIFTFGRGKSVNAAEIPLENTDINSNQDNISMTKKLIQK